MKLAMFVACWSTLAAYSVNAETVDEVLEQMEAAQRVIDSFSCKMTVTTQYCGHDVKNEKGEMLLRPFDDPKEWLPPQVTSHEIIVSGEMFNFTETRLDQPAAQPVHTVWDGNQYIEYKEGTGAARLEGSPRVYGGPIVYDPRVLAYRRAPNESMFDVLRDGLAKGVLTISDAVLNDVPVIYIECVYPQGKITDDGYKVWVDPARGFMPIQIQQNQGPFLGHRYTEIELREVSPGVWFPIKGIVSEYPFYNAPYRTKVIVSLKVEVDVDSIKLNPAVSDTTFGISLPAGTEVHDRRTKPEIIYQVSRAPDVESDIFMEADVAKAEMVNASVAAVTNPSDTARHFMFGRKALAVYGSLMLFGFVMSWLLTRSRRA